jgi:hypothetical protein
MLGSSSPCHLLMFLFTSIFRPWSCGQHHEELEQHNVLQKHQGITLFFVFFFVQTKLRRIQTQVVTFQIPIP